MKTLLTTLYFLPILLNAQTIVKRTYYFELGSSKLLRQSEIELNNLLDSIQYYDVNNIEIVGYTDNIGSDKDNVELSKERAELVSSQIKKQLSSFVKFSVKGMGAKDLIVKNLGEQQLNRRVEITMEINKKNKKSLRVFGLQEDVETQIFQIDLSDTIFIIGKGGTKIKIEPNTLMNKYGTPAIGKAIIKLKEYYTPSQIILAGLGTCSEEDLLQTGGMFKIVFIQNGDTLPSSTLKQVEMKMPVANENLTGMNVFQSYSNDSSHWRNSQTPFKQIKGYWEWGYSKKLNDFYDNNYNYILKNMKIGKTFSDEFFTRTPFISLVNNDDNIIQLRHPYAKKIWYSFTKLDSNTVNVNLKVKYRNRGFRNFKVRSFDTALTVKYVRPQYIGLTKDLSWINCDRFYRNRNKTDFYVTTSGFEGMSVMVYFKEINAYLQANYDGNKYVVKNVPENMLVKVIALGKDGDKYYYGNEEVITKKNVNPAISVNETRIEKIKESLNIL